MPVVSYESFSRFLFSIDCVTYVGPEHHMEVGVETEEQATELRQLVDPSISVFVTGSIIVSESEESPLHPGVQTYVKVAEETKP